MNRGDDGAGWNDARCGLMDDGGGLIQAMQAWADAGLRPRRSAAGLRTGPAGPRAVPYTATCQNEHGKRQQDGVVAGQSGRHNTSEAPASRLSIRASTEHKAQKRIRK